MYLDCKTYFLILPIYREQFVGDEVIMKNNYYSMVLYKNFDEQNILADNILQWTKLLDIHIFDGKKLDL